MTNVDHLVAVAQDLVCRVRDDDPEANERWLRSQLPDAADREKLLYLLAAAVPTDRPWSHLVAWFTGPPETDVQRRQRQWRESQQRTTARRRGVA